MLLLFFFLYPNDMAVPLVVCPAMAPPSRLACFLLSVCPCNLRDGQWNVSPEMFKFCAWEIRGLWASFEKNRHYLAINFRVIKTWQCDADSVSSTEEQNNWPATNENPTKLGIIAQRKAWPNVAEQWNFYVLNSQIHSSSREIIHL